jgi:hypothetical protein
METSMTAKGKSREELEEMLIKPEGGIRQKAPHDNTDTSPIALTADTTLHAGVIETEVIIYVLETGTAPTGQGSTAKIKGSITTTGSVSGEFKFEAGLPEETSWTQNNNGLGLMIYRKIFRTLMIPPNFNVWIYVEGGIGHTMRILDRRVNFADNPEWMWGFWWWFDSAPENSNYKAYIAWSVKDGMGSQGPGGLHP